MSPIGDLRSGENFTLFDVPESGFSSEGGECRFVRARHPRLGAKPKDFVEQRAPAVNIQMSRDIDQQ